LHEDRILEETKLKTFYKRANICSNIKKTIENSIKGYFPIFECKEVRVSVLCDELTENMGFNKNDVIEVVEKLLDEGVLHEPKQDHIELVNWPLHHIEVTFSNP
jgi:hypothetical protein